MTNLQSNTYDLLKGRFSKLDSETKRFFKTHTGEYTKEEKACILNLLTEKLQLLKEMSKMQYDKICNN